MQSKLNNTYTLASAVSGAQNLDLNVTIHKDFGLSVKYAAGSTGNIAVAYSISGNTAEYATDLDSVQALDIAGGVHIWNITDVHLPFLRVILPAGILTATVLAVGEGVDKRG